MNEIGFSKGQIEDAFRRYLYATDGKSFEIQRQLHILDAGCGSGNYSHALLQMGVGKVSLFDASNGMLNRAKEKLQSYVNSGHVASVKQGSLPTIPFPDGTFDAIMFNFVVHHLDTPEESRRFPNVRLAVKEAFRVLRPGGLFTAICQYPEQTAGGWFTQLLPKKLDDYLRRFPDADDIRSMTDEAGFTSMDETCMYDADYFTDYHNPEGPFSKSWRAGDSYWSQLDENELKSALKNLKEMKAAGKAEDFVKEKDGSLSNGSCTIITALK